MNKTNLINRALSGCQRWGNRLAIVVVFCSICPLTIGLWAQATDKPSGQEQSESDELTAEAKQVKQELDDLVDQWRTVMMEAGEAGTTYFNGEFEQSAASKQKFEAAVKKGNALKLQVRDKAVELFELSGKPDRDFKRLVLFAMEDLANQGHMEKVYHLARRMLSYFPDDEPMLVAIGFTTISTNRYDEAAEFLQNHGGLVTKMGDSYRALYTELPALLAAKSNEKEADARAAAEDDLPRVKLVTTKGDIIVELFENEAPDTVGNFISLVESGFYKDSKFHRVISQFMAQTGCPDGNGRGGPGYMIVDEHGGSRDRHHFSYVLSMANSGQPNSAGSQFFITYHPQLRLDKKHCVFGRVIEGFEVVDSLQKTFIQKDGDEEPIEGATPDEIISAEVIRKRDHEYLPNKVEAK